MHQAILATAIAIIFQATPATPNQSQLQPSQTQTKPTPCVPSSVVPKHVRIGVPSWLQKQINKQAIRFGTTIDTNAIIVEATKPQPCPAATLPPPPPPTTKDVKPAQLPPLPPVPPATKDVKAPPKVTVECQLLILPPLEPGQPTTTIVAIPDSSDFAVPTRENEIEWDDYLPTFGGTVPCWSLRRDPRTMKYFSIATAWRQTTPTTTQPTPKQ